MTIKNFSILGFIIVAFVIIIIVAVVSFFVYIILKYIESEKKREELKSKIKALASNALTLTPKEFFDLRDQKLWGDGNKKYALTLNFEGVYILYNETKDLYYVGQAQKVLDRVSAHFKGHGNGDVYADYKYGDSFKIKMISLENSGFLTLNELERYTIESYDAYNKGYNKTRGNK